MAKLKIGVLVSGSGTNLQAILDAIQAGTLEADVRIVISNRPGAQALERARDAGVPTSVISHREFPERMVFDRHLVSALREADVGLVVLAGSACMRHVRRSRTVSKWPDARSTTPTPALTPVR